MKVCYDQLVSKYTLNCVNVSYFGGFIMLVCSKYLIVCLDGAFVENNVTSGGMLNPLCLNLTKCILNSSENYIILYKCSIQTHKVSLFQTYIHL